MPKISVVMPVFNVEKNVLLASTESILKQSFKDIELIICDDGSTNVNTKRALQEISKLDSRIKVLGYKVNHGQAFARNKCIETAQGQYVAFQDSDDISEPNRLEEEYVFLREHTEYGFVGSIGNVFEKNKVWGRFNVPERPIKNDFLWNSPFLNPSMLFKTDVLKKVHGFKVSKETLRAEDYDLFFRLYAAGYKGYNIQHALVNYRIDIQNEKHKKYRPMSDRINEAKVRYSGFKSLNLGLKSIPYVVKPIIIGLIPTNIFYKIRKRQYERP